MWVLNPKFLIIIAACAGMFVIVLTMILLSAPNILNRRDQALAFKKQRNPDWEMFALWINDAIAPHTIGIVYSLLCLVWIAFGEWHLLGITCSGISVAVLGFRSIKRITQRARPSDARLQLSDFSFPSGHTTVSTVLFFTLASYGVWFGLPEMWIGFVLALLGAGVVGWSRWYLKVHRVGDVLTGFVLGVGSFLLAWLFFLYFGQPLITAIESVFIRL